MYQNRIMLIGFLGQDATTTAPRFELCRPVACQQELVQGGEIAVPLLPYSAYFLCKLRLCKRSPVTLLRRFILTQGVVVIRVGNFNGFVLSSSH